MTTTRVPPEHLVDFDRMDSALAPDLHAVVGRLREHPVAWTEHHGGHWIVSGYPEIHEILRTPEVFTSSSVNIPGPVGAGDKLVPLELDGDEHRRYRELLLPLFAPRRMAELEPRIEELSRRLVAEAVAQDSVEVVEAIATPLPVTMFLALMGWPLEDKDKLIGWASTILNGPVGMELEEFYALVGQVGAEVAEYFGALIDARGTTDPQADYTAVVLGGKLADGTDIPRQRMLDMLMLLMQAGLDTVKSALSFALYRLATRPDLQRALAADPSLIPAAVEEFLRWDPPAWPARVVGQDTDFHGFPFRQGDRVLLAFTAGDRDAVEFERPEDLRFDRARNRHLAFSAGPHRCIGSHLARLELRIALREWFAAVPSFTLDEERPPELYLGGVFGVRRLHLRRG
jgi:cytochrome P450